MLGPTISLSKHEDTLPEIKFRCLLALTELSFRDLTSAERLCREFEAHWNTVSFLLTVAFCRCHEVWSELFCQRLTLLSPPCSSPCCSLSACQNNEGTRKRSFRGVGGGAEWGQPARCPHEYSVLHMVPCIRICIHLKALIRTPHLNTSGCACCQRAS